MSFLNLAGKTFLISGVANKKSVAAFCAQTLIAEGADCIFTVQKEDQLLALSKLFPGSKSLVVDVSSKDSIAALGTHLRDSGVYLNGFLHSLAFANFEHPAPFHETRREDFLEAAQISSFSFVEMANALKECFVEDASLVTISISNTRATSYGYLGPIKAMLDATVPYLAKSFSETGRIRVNAVGAGPLKTSASAGIPNYIDNYLYAEALTLRKKALETQEVANTVAFLLSERSSGINATTVLVDAGMSCNYFDQEVVAKFSGK